MNEKKQFTEPCTHRVQVKTVTLSCILERIRSAYLGRSSSQFSLCKRDSEKITLKSKRKDGWDISTIKRKIVKMRHKTLHNMS